VGEGDPIILVAGAFSYRKYKGLVQLSRLLSSRFTVINYDRRGRGDSDDKAPYGVHLEIDDLEALAKDTHKFESRYLDGLIGPYPQRKGLYMARSPIRSARLLTVPVAFFQGAEDRVVPPQQAEEMVNALRQRRIPFLYLLFDGEQHGFRRAENIKRALDAELYFYATFLTDQRLEFRVS